MESLSVRSVPSKLILFLGFISIVITSVKNFHKQKLLGQAIIYYFIAKNADCLIYRNCDLKFLTKFLLGDNFYELRIF